MSTGTRGRPSLIREVFSFEDPQLIVPDEVVLDTSFVVRALVTTEDGHQACKAFMLQLVDNESTIFYNRLLEIEFAETAFKLAVVEQHGKKAWPAKRNDGRVRRRAGRLSRELLASWRQLLSSALHLCIELDEVAEEVPGLMAKHGLASMDAAHVATALYASTGIVTTDAGFGCVPADELRLFVDASRVRSCRRRRGGNFAKL